MHIIGLDISTHLGFSALTPEGEVVAAHSLHIKPKLYPQREERWADYANQVVALVNKCGAQLVCIEGYGYANANTLAPLVELGAVVRHRLYCNGIPFIEVAPASLKKFVTGKGNAAKQVMLLEVFKRFGFETSDDDIADAVALAHFGRALLGLPVTLPASHLDALTAVRASQARVLQSIATA